MEAGATRFAWGGRDDSGVRLPVGFYYLRASCAGTAVVRGVILIP